MRGRPERDESPKARRSADGGGGHRVHGLRRTERSLEVEIGISIFLMAVGAILAFAVHVPANGINLATVGVILMILGLIGLLASLAIWGDRW
jgi:uncharacterized membrane protein